MTGYYRLSLVALSVAVAIIASYTALDLASRVSESHSTPRKAWTWLSAGALSMGCGIWSMHFIGMLAFQLPIPMAYDWWISGLSLFSAVVASALALMILRRPQLELGSLVAGAVLMGIAISAMHYLGMAALRMYPPIQYDVLLFATSVLIAMLASFAALWIALRLRRNLSRYAVLAKLASAVVMGFAIAGMHYTGMAAAHFSAGSVCRAVVAGGIAGNTLAVAIGCIAMAIMTLTLILSTLDGYFAQRNAQLAASLQVAKDFAEAALRENERITAELRAAQSEIVASARKAGMAEIASGVLHNVGNVLNSVNVSAGQITNLLRQSKLDGLAQGVQMLNEHSTDLPRFLEQDEKGRRLLGYLTKATQALSSEKTSIGEEVAALVRSIEHIKDIVATQQSYAGTTTVAEPVMVDALLEDALRMNSDSLERHQIAVEKQVQPLPQLLLDKHLVLQILINLLANAKQAMEGVQGRLTLRATANGAAVKTGRLHICVEDNGIGIAAENLQKIFNYGFTTRKSGHGFGLHSCALAAKAMGGTLVAQSEGLGRGARFILDLPLKVA